MPESVSHVGRMTQTALWHNMLGHAPVSNIKRIKGLEGVKENESELCITCPLAKFTMPYKPSKSRAEEMFDLVHIDIWGPYKVATRH